MNVMMSEMCCIDGCEQKGNEYDTYKMKLETMSSEKKKIDMELRLHTDKNEFNWTSSIWELAD